jgi:arylsulfatase A-like enzyme
MNGITKMVPVALMGSLAFGCSVKPKPASTEKMNILFITVEDWTTEAIGCYGNPVVKTPNVDRLAQKGVQFMRSYCQGVVCNPSRASFTTGLRPETINVYGNADDCDNFITAAHPNMAGILKQKGAYMAQTGKLMHKWKHSFNVINFFDQIEMEKPFLDENGKVIDQEPDRGPFEGVTKYKTVIPDYLPATEKRDWVWVPDKLHDSELVRLQKERDAKLAAGEPDTWPLRKPFQQYHAEMIGDMGFEENYSEDGLVAFFAEKMIDDFANEGKQFFLHAGFYAPHSPLLAPKEFVEMYDTANISISTRTRDKDSGVPDIAVRNGNNYDIFNGMYPQFAPTPERQKLAIQAYYATSSYVDAQIGKLLDALERNGLSENTIVVMFADHGFHLGEHGCWSKFTVFEESIKIPLLVYVPGAKANGKKVDEIVELVDLLPTFCDLWGIEKDERFEGTSFTPLLDNPEQEWKKAAFSMVPKPLNAHTVRTKRYRYAEYGNTQEPDVEEKYVAIELYDHEKDPFEQVNLAGNPDYASVEAEMKALLHGGWKGALPESVKQ